MRLVIDTNVLVEAITSRSPYHKIFKSLVVETNELIISNEILSEYIEVFGRIYSEQLQKEILKFFDYSEAILKIDPRYHFYLIESDVDDNKFVDCAICGNCDFLITSDHHFNVLNQTEFPKVNIISPEEFIKNYL